MEPEVKLKIKLLSLSVFILLNTFSFSPLRVARASSPDECGVVYHDPDFPVNKDFRTKLCTIRPGIDDPETVTDLIVRIIQIMTGLAFIIALGFVIYGGYQFIFSAGNVEKAKGGKRTLQHALLGLAVIVLSYVIVSLVARTVATYRGGTP